MSQSLKKKAKIPFIFLIFLQTLQADTKNLQILQTDFSVRPLMTKELLGEIFSKGLVDEIFSFSEQSRWRQAPVSKWI